MPRIDPLQLLKCLSVLLSPSGGIKSKDEVQRLASLMTKFSKKLVSKCIYIQILKTTKTDLLGMFMAAGGWNLIHTWLSDAIVAKNWPLIQELLELLLMCPVDVERLKTNNCPKLIKGLSKESSNESVKLLASKLVEQWLRIVKGETEAARQQSLVVAIADNKSVDVIEETVSTDEVNPEESRTEVENEEDRTCVSEPSEVNSESVEVKSEPMEVRSENVEVKNEPEETVEVKREVVAVAKPEIRLAPEMRLEPRVDLQKLKPGKDFIIKADNTLVCEGYAEEAAANELPVYKITIRDGKQVLAKVSNKRVEVEEESAVSDEESMVKPVTKTYSRASNNAEQSSCVKKETEADVKPAIVNDVKSSPTKAKVKSEKLENSTESPKLSKDVKKIKEIQSSSKMNDKKSKSNELFKEKKESDKDREKDKEKDKSKEKLKQRENKQKEKKPSTEKLDAQAERDKATLAKLIPPAISKLGKIPKKPKIEDPSKELAKPIEIKKPGGEIKKLPLDVKKPPPPPEPSSRKASISIEVRKPLDGSSRPKTVKTFNSKFRSTGLEEEVKPPPPRPIKKNIPPPVEKRPPLKLPNLKRPSPPKDMLVPPEKKLKPTIEAAVEEPKKIEKPSAIKPITAKPKPSFLQESDMFMDALNASSKKEPRKRKRRIASSNDGPEAKKEPVTPKEEEAAAAAAANKDSTPPSSPANNENGKSPPLVRPTFKFYQDTLETNEEDEATKSTEPKEGDDAEEGNEEERKTPTPPTEEMEGSPKTNDETSEGDNAKDEPSEEKSEDSDEAKEKDIDISLLGGRPKGVLVYHKSRKGPKKVVRWKTEKELETIKYFELDETERVNVTKNFMDMKQMERTHEREAFLLARKLPQVDTMEEKIPWQALIPIDMPPNLVEPGKNSREKDVQYAREKVILQALYFNRNMIPDSAAEPDMEIHPTTDPVIIPLDDVTGNLDSINDFQNTPWPEPKPMIIPQSPPPQFQQPQPAFNQFPNASFASQQVFPSQGNIATSAQGPSGSMMVPSSMSMPAAGGDWRTGDGKVVPVNEIPMQMDMYNQGGPPMGMPGMPGPGMPLMGGPGPEMNYNMMGEDMGPYPPQGPFPMAGPHGPPGPGMFPYRGGSRGGMRGGRGNNQMGPRGPGGPWFRPMGGGNWQPPPGGTGGGAGGGPVRRGGRGGWNPNRGICKHFRGGFCRQGDKCSFLHPGVNDLHQF